MAMLGRTIWLVAAAATALLAVFRRADEFRVSE